MELPEHKRGWKLEENPRLPEAIPVPNADQPDTPSLGGFVERCLHLFAHRTAKFQTLACISRLQKFIEYNEVKYSGRSGNYQISM